MSAEEYISSGVLEAYAMDQLSSQERVQVEQMIRTNPAIEEELSQIEETLESLAQAAAINPKQDLKGKILDQVATREESPVIPMQQSPERLWWRYAAAASIVIAISSSLMALNFWRKWQAAEGQVAEMLVQNQVVAENYTQVNQRLDALETSIAIMNDSGFERIEMKGTENEPRALATVYHDPEAERVYLSIQNLGQLSREQQYQLWAIIDGEPVDAGVFDLTDDALLIPMKSIGEGVAAFAVTIEPSGGSETPSLETMQVIGNA